ncbi:MAG: queuosine precursor transporter [Phycisphaerales bacterium]|nr:queuosine precursor transporter [Phycisphaerae bacterium]NNF42553.1 queuosine precursor transporter [Phycisphaerales bacterium]NNM25095.1 queuosine precursor transporter [Phycisphaerales bacterium]
MPRRLAALHPIEASALHARRERVFLVLAGLFLGTLAMLNILGVTRFIKLLEVDRDDGGALVFAVAVGVLPYPVTFLCTDFISELYGRARANAVVWVGLLLNLWVMLILWVGGTLPGFEPLGPDGAIVRDAADRLPVFFEVRTLAFGAVAASMIAYLAAQLIDVYLFHLWKKLTGGRHLWLRNNGSTIISQLVDTVAVILITYSIGGLAGVVDETRPVAGQLLLLIATGYAFKFTFAAIDTIPFYLGVRWLSRFLQIDPQREHEADREEVRLPPASSRR